MTATDTDLCCQGDEGHYDEPEALDANRQDPEPIADSQGPGNEPEALPEPVKIRRIGFVGAPGAGKSHAARYFCNLFDAAGERVQLVQEVIKPKACAGIPPVGWDQYYLFCQQLQAEEVYLKTSAVDLIITDADLSQMIFYRSHGRFPGWKSCLFAHEEFEAQYPSVQVFLPLGPKEEFVSAGRYQDWEQSKEIERRLRDFYLKSGLKLYSVEDVLSWVGGSK